MWFIGACSRSGTFVSVEINTYQIYLFVAIHCGLKDAGTDQGHALEFPIRPEVDEKEIKWKDGHPLLRPCGSHCEEGTRWNMCLS